MKAHLEQLWKLRQSDMDGADAVPDWTQEPLLKHETIQWEKASLIRKGFGGERTFFLTEIAVYTMGTPNEA